MINKKKMELWKTRIKTQEQSELSVTRWCKEQNHSTNSFYHWKKIISQEEKNPMTETPATIFAEVYKPEKEVVSKSTKLEVQWKNLYLQINTSEEAELAACLIISLDQRC